MPDKPRFAVVMAVLNGERFLPAQLDTIEKQTVPIIDLWISDDGSTDGSQQIVTEAAATWSKGECRLVSGPSAGFAENFRSLMLNPEIDGDYVAFSDQDDLWDGNKLQRALTWLERQPADRPALYCSRTRSVSANGEYVGMSPEFQQPPAFSNAIVQSIAGGNTMVMNRSAWRLVREAASRTSFVSHDWWCYLIVTGAGGAVHYSATSDIGYRQHDDNLVGANNSWQARMSRLSGLFQGQFAQWNDQNLQALAACDDLLTPDARRIVDAFRAARNGSLLSRLTALRRSGAHRQTRAGQIGLYLACILGRL